jgi:hypothetical protein
MPDVLRHGFRLPTEQQKRADAEYVAAGGVLTVTALPISHERQGGLRWTPQGRFFVTSSTMTWKASRLTNLPDVRFDKADWIVRLTPQTQWSGTKFVLVSLVNENDRTIHHEFRVPTPDADLIATVLNTD